MTKRNGQPQFDLFEPAPPPPPRQRGGIPRHVPTAESKLKVREMQAAGETQEAIARALGIGTSTLAKYYFPSVVSNPPMGRRRHAPTPARRDVVRRAIRIGLTQAQVARLLGITVPTLRLHYRDEMLG